MIFYWGIVERFHSEHIQKFKWGQWPKTIHEHVENRNLKFTVLQRGPGYFHYNSRYISDIVMIRMGCW